MAKKKYTSELDKSKKKKKEAEEGLEYLRQVELPESQGGGRKFISDYLTEEQRKEQEANDAYASVMQAYQQRRFGYKERLVKYAQDKAIELVPDRWTIWIVQTNGEDINVHGKNFKTQDGIVFILRSPSNGVYMRAIGVAYDAIVDMKNMDTMIVIMENTIDSAKGILLGDNKDTHSTFKETKIIT